jgi:hypothetical protein
MPLVSRFATIDWETRMTTISVYPSAQARVPRGSTWAASAALSTWGLMSRLFGQGSPAKAASPTAEAAAVRALAREFMTSDPGFAADLFAAADRHEGVYDGR